MPYLKILPLLLALCLSLAAPAQNSAEYRVEKGEKDFVLVQNGQYVVFDTLQVQTNLAQKTGEVSDLETEIALLERLIHLRRQWVLAREEKRTLNDILEKARRCAATPSEH
jgi:hypothetical protein